MQCNKPLIMGILNVTPDSFSDGGLYLAIDKAIQQAQVMMAEGASIIDVGGESTRPGSDAIPIEEQIERVVPVIMALRQLELPVKISIDTTQSQVAKAALLAGADMINDVSGGEDDECILDLVAEARVPIVLMHRQGLPKTMQDNPYYEDVVPEVLASLQAKVKLAVSKGVLARQIILDPGIGFGKRRQDNLDLLAQIGQFVALGYPILLGTSRKRFMGTLCNVEKPSELVAATVATTAIGVMAGVKLFRVHDVKANRQALDVAWAIKQAQESG